MRKVKHLGFTLVELLATIVILGIILGIAIPSYHYYIRFSKEKAFKTAEDAMKVAASNALTQCMTSPVGETVEFCNVHKAPGSQYEYDVTTGDDLVKFGYIDPIADPNDPEKTCDMTNSYVYISNKANSEEENNNDFVYKVCLICGDRKSEDCRDDILNNETSEFDTFCKISYDQEGVSSYDGKWTDQDLFLNFSASGEYKYGINQYKYRIGSSKWDSVKASNDVAFKRLTESVSNKEIHSEAYDGLNQKATTTCTSDGGTYVKIDKTIITGVTITGKQTDGKKVDSDSWSMTDVVLTAEVNPKETPSGYYYTWYKDGEVISGATSKTYTATLRGVYKVEVTNGVRKQVVTSSDFIVKIDKNKPTCSLASSGNMNGEWYVGDVTTVFTNMNDLEDDGLLGSGIISQSIDKGVSSEDGNPVTITGTVKDAVGRVGTCTSIVKHDTKKPDVKVKEPLLSLGNGDYDFKDNLEITFGPAGGTIVCDPASSKKTGTYSVTCTATSNVNGKTTTVTFDVRHSYPATYVSKQCRDCTQHWGCISGCTPCNPMVCICGYPDDCCSHAGCCEQQFNSCCCNQEGWVQSCGAYYECGNYTCPNGGRLSGSTCYYD